MKKKINTVVVSVMMCLSMVSCGENKTEKTYFTNWNECTSLTTLKEFVADVTDEKSKNFIPVEDRIATFDMDGTFVGELMPSYFEYNILEYRVLEDPTYKDIAPDDVKETAQNIRDFVREGTALPRYNDEYGFDLKHAYAAAKAYSGMTLEEFDTYVKDYGEKPANGFTNLKCGHAFYKPMLDVFEYLNDNQFTNYVVSGSDRFICRALVDAIDFDPAHVIGMDVVLESDNQGETDGVNYTYTKNDTLKRTDELIIKNLKTNKVKQIAQEIGKTPVLSFGNSGGDSAMHNYCLQNEKYKSAAFMLVADDDERDHAKKRGEDDAAFQARIAKLNSDWTNNQYNVISMKNDFATIYGKDVQKVDFTF